MNKKQLSFLLLIIFIIGLYMFQNKAVTPFVLKVIDSDLYMKQTQLDEAPRGGIVESDLSQTALIHCNKYLKSNYDLGGDVELTQKDQTAWSLGDNGYVIRSKFDLVSPSEIQTGKNYVCKIKFYGGNEADFDNWSVSGFDFE